MRHPTFALALALLAGPVDAGLYVAPRVDASAAQIPDMLVRLSTLETSAQSKAQVDAAIASATSSFDTVGARTAAVSSAVSGLDTVAARVAAVPPICTTMPSADTYGGRVGTSPACTPPSDAARATVIQAVQVVTASDASFSGTWPAPFASAPIAAHATVYGQSQPFICSILTKTATGFTGKCWILTTTTLPSTLTAIQGLVLSPFQTAAANLPITVTGRQ